MNENIDWLENTKMAIIQVSIGGNRPFFYLVIPYANKIFMLKALTNSNLYVTLHAN